MIEHWILIICIFDAKIIKIMRSQKGFIISLFLLINLFFSVALSAQNKTDSNGKKQGNWSKFQDGKKVYEGQFKDDIPFGEFKYFYPKGSLKIKTVFSKLGRLNRTKLYFDSWKESLQAQGNYWDKKKDSIWDYFNEDSYLIARETYKNGIKQGAHLVYNHVGQIHLEQFYENDSLHGISTEYLENGEKFRQITYQKGKYHGLFRLFYPDGKILLQGNYVDDKRDSIWTTYSESGEIEFLDYYSNGLLIKRTDKEGKKLELKLEEETIPLHIDPSKMDPTVIKR
jgi:antitoxin component YwqK of YwqJK toxin-antitoxin module